MATGTVYPNNLDTFKQQADGGDILADETNKQSSAIEQLEQKLGAGNSADEQSIDYRVRALEQEGHSGLQQEIQDRIAADAALQEQITPNTENIATLTAGLETETENRTGADAQLQNDIAAEAQTRTQTVGAVQSNLDTAVQTLQGVDNTKIDKAIAPTLIEDIWISDDDPDGAALTGRFRNPQDNSYQDMDVEVPVVDATHAGIVTSADKAQIDKSKIDPDDKVLTQTTSGTMANLSISYSGESGLLSLYGKNSTLIGTANIGAAIAGIDHVDVVTDPSGQPAGTYLALYLTNGDITYLNVNLLANYTASGAVQIDTQNNITLKTSNNANLNIGENGLEFAEGYQAMTAAQSAKLAGIASGAEVNVQSDWNQTSSSADDYVKNKPVSMPASDVSPWAKATNKPSYTAAEVGAVSSVSLASGTNNGTMKLTVNGTATDNVAVKGLGSAAYTNSGAYATAAQGVTADNAVPNARKVNNKQLNGDITLNAADVGALSSSEKGAANGVAPLGADSKVPLANLPEMSGGGSGLDQSLQNIINEQNGMSAVPQASGMHDSFMSDENVVFNLAANYAQGSTTIKLSIVQPDTLDEFKQKYMYPFLTQIYDKTNKSYMVLTGDDGNGNFTLAAPLVNLNGAQVPYVTSNTISKMHMFAVSNGTATIPDDLDGQARKFPENIDVKYFPATLNNKTLHEATNFNPTKRYKVASLPNTYTIVLQSDTNDSALFPAVDARGQSTVVTAFNRITNAEKVLTLSAAASYSSPNLTLQVNESTAGLDTSSWYAIKSPVLSARVEDISQAQELVRVGIEKALLQQAKKSVLYDTFQTGDTTSPNLYNNWIGYIIQTGAIRINSNTLCFFGNGGEGGAAVRNFEKCYDLTAIRNGLDVYVEYCNTGNNSYATFWFSLGSKADNSIDGLVVWTRTDNGGMTLSDTSGQLASTTVSTSPVNTWRAIRILTKNNNIKIYFGDNENNLVKVIDYTKPVNFGISGDCLKLRAISGESGGRESIRKVFIKKGENIINVIGSLPAQTGNKLTTAIALPIADSASESPSLSGIAGYLG
jgi:hypothetical protein